MEKEPKFKLGQKVFICFDDYKIHEKTITGISINKNGEYNYHIDFEGFATKENFLKLSKKELIIIGEKEIKENYNYKIDQLHGISKEK